MEQKIKDNFFCKLLGKQGLIQPLFVDPNAAQSSKKIYSTIYEALNNVQSGGTIKIMPGVYRENLEIKTSNIKLQANDPNSNVIIINSLYPSVKVNLSDQKQTVYFESIKFAHSCNNQQGFIENLRDLNYMDDQINLFESGDNMNTIVFIKKGRVIIQQCKFSLNVINTANKSIVPIIIIEQQGHLNMSRCQLFGSNDRSQQTIGILNKRGSAIVKQSNFYNHRRSAFYLSGNKQTLLKIQNCKIKDCFYGIILIGDFRALIQNNIIQNCEGIGIKMGMCNRSKISANTISKNTIGIVYTNADPEILNNQIYFNRQEGILCIAKQMIKSQGQIKFNVIKENKQSGIRCVGTANQVKISCNTEISFNKKCGILVDNNAYPHIFRNLIEKNLGQGILIKDGSSAFIQKNEISHNLKSNIALGGKNSINTIIIENKIHSGRCEGIFLIHAARFLITKNHISNNHQGITAISSITRIEDNHISLNETNGILVTMNSKLEILNNKIQKNNAAGIFIRDTSSGKIQRNQILDNRYQLIIQKAHDSLKSVERQNKFHGELRIPQNYYNCLLM